MSATIPQPLALFLPWLAAALAAWLTTDKLSQLLNGLIIVLVFLVALGLCLVTSGLPLTGLSVTIVIAYVAGVMGLLKPLMDYLSLKVPSPLATLAPARIVAASPMTAQGTTSTAGTIRSTPQPLTLPEGRQFIAMPPPPGNTILPGAPPAGTPPPSNG